MPLPAAGPLSGLRVVEFAGIGPGPFAAMLLADMGADVVRIERPGADGSVVGPRTGDITLRGRRIVTLDLKSDDGISAALALLDAAEALIEGFRPGVMERLGLGPEVACARNPRLVYGRMTGWGQSGPLAQSAGHDITYLAITGALGAIGPAGGAPVPPLNLVGDYGGGALYLAMGILAAVLAARAGGQGQVIDCAITEGVLSMLSLFHSLRAWGRWEDARGSNLLDGGAHFYGTYECADGRHIAVGAIEPQFYATLRRLAGLDDPAFDDQRDPRAWPGLRARMAAVFRTRSQAEWCALLEGSEACVAPVLALDEAAGHAHNVARASFVSVEGVRQAAPAPRFSRTPGAAGGRPRTVSPESVLADWRGG
ncbi:MAG: CoA transferase [Rhodospirillales bacterium]|nr:CoA transferase [Rhodospirillales bacterium]